MGELGGEILTPGSDTTLGGGALQWPLPVAGTITSPQGYRTDPSLPCRKSPLAAMSELWAAKSAPTAR